MTITHLFKCISIVTFLIASEFNVVDERILRTCFKRVTTVCQEHKGIHTHTQREQNRSVYQRENGKDDNYMDMNIVLTCCMGIIVISFHEM